MAVRTGRRDFLINTARLAGGLAVASCVPAQTGAPSSAPSGGGTASAAVANKTLKIATPVEVVDAQPYNQTSTGVYSQMYAALYDTITGRSDKYDLEPRIAESWTPLDDKTWQFKIRKGIKFHNGDPLTAEDVRFSIAHTYDPQAKTIYASSFAVAKMEMPDDYTLNITMKTADPFLPQKFSARPAYVVPSKYFQQVGIDGMNAKPVGTGPYQFKERVPGSTFTVVKNPNYWRAPVPADEITAVFRPDQTARIAALKTGEVDIIKDVPYDQIDTVNALSNARIVPVPSITISKYLINARAKPLSDVRIRQALSLSVDRDLLNKSIGHGLYEIVNGPLGPSDFGYDPSFPKLTYDPDRAKSLMKEAGYNNEPIPLETIADSANALEDQAVAEQWKKVGFNIQMVAMDAATRARKIANPKEGFLGITWVGFSSKYGDADGIVWRTQKPGGSLRYWEDEEFDRLGAQQTTSTDQALRKQIWHRMVEIMLAAMPQVYMWIEPSMWGVNNRIDIKPSTEENDDFGVNGHLTFKS